MTKCHSTYELAAGQIARYVQSVTAGDLAAPFETRDETGRVIKLADDHLSGCPLFLVFLNRVQLSEFSALLQKLCEIQPDLHAKGNTRAYYICAKQCCDKSRVQKQVSA